MKKYTTPQKISKVELTADQLTGRGGLALFNRYLSMVGIFALLDELFGAMRKSLKGLAIWKLFKQIMLFFFDGTSRHLSYFDHLKKDEGYAGAIEESCGQLASSHTMKRFFKMFPWLAGGVFRKVLKRLFIWRLRQEQPEVIELTLDTMVMDNDEAQKRHGVQPTYKKVKGFQPLQMIWNGFIVDAVFRGGKKHSNFGNTVVNMVTQIVQEIRREYRQEVTIILRVDSGFFDEINFNVFNELNIGFIGTGKMYQGVKDHVSQATAEMWGSYDNGHQQWSLLEFGYRCDSWQGFWRAIYTRPMYENQQRLLDFARPDNVVLTNLGINAEALKYLSAEKQAHWVRTETIVANHHSRGADELPHRGLKDFGFEQLPFKRFAPNSAFYYCMLLSFFLFEAYKRDVLSDVIPISSYATTVRRRAVDFAAKIVSSGHQFILKVPRAVMEALQFDGLWQRCQNPIPIQA